MMPKSYRATVSLLVDTRDEQSLSDALRPLVLPQERMSYLQTQVDILTSPKVARAVAQELRLAETPGALAALGMRGGRGGRTEELLVEVLRRNFKAETSQSSVIQASFTCADPRWAAAIANAYAKAYVDTMLELRVAPTRKAAAWFDEQLKGLRANLEDAQAKLAQAKLAVQAKATQHPESIPQVADNAFVQQLKAELLHGEEKLQELATQYGVNHPVYRRQVSENQTLRTRLQTEMRKLAEGAAAAGVEAGPDDALRAGRAGPQAPEEAVLVRNVQSAERAYETAMQRYVVSQVDSRASQTNVEVLNPAVAPLKPYRPNMALNIVLSLFTGVERQHDVERHVGAVGLQRRHRRIQHLDVRLTRPAVDLTHDVALHRGLVGALGRLHVAHENRLFRGLRPRTARPESIVRPRFDPGGRRALSELAHLRLQSGAQCLVLGNLAPVHGVVDAVLRGELLKLLFSVQQLGFELLHEGIVRDLRDALRMLRGLRLHRKLRLCELRLRILQVGAQALELLVEPDRCLARRRNAQLEHRVDIGLGIRVGDRGGPARIGAGEARLDDAALRGLRLEIPP